MSLIYIVNKNADFTEGRGPMVFYKAFATLEDAQKHIMELPGIYGSTQQRDKSLSKVGREWYNGYEILTATVYTYESASSDYQRKVKENALSKLTAEEKLILGIKE